MSLVVQEEGSFQHILRYVIVKERNEYGIRSGREQRNTSPLMKK